MNWALVSGPRIVLAVGGDGLGDGVSLIRHKLRGDGRRLHEIHPLFNQELW
jgi:hypothetical protein